ncbi:hypothetical protein PHISCL_00193 [Aspergillus sclerotialis]|uniref:Uncharacterized protein n=1 Tax=Aspergillus sclerotialis TaxID=2070753 RepID=A0A3A2ZWD3_9EURO|nr:hypothetical protein PHISCL_00193 [Aspergillus sclerotialis]
MDDPSRNYSTNPTTLTFTTNGLYIILTDMGHETLYHWGLYLSQSPHDGSPHTDHKWTYQSKPNTGVPYSAQMLVVVKIGVIDEDLHESLMTALAEVSTDEPVTCRVWLRRALDKVHERGIVIFTGRISEVEAEAADFAFRNRMNRRQSVESSTWRDGD